MAEVASCKRCGEFLPFGHIELTGDINAVDENGNRIVLAEAGIYCRDIDTGNVDGGCLEVLLHGVPAPSPKVEAA